MRLADAELLPFEFGDFADTVQTYVKELKALSQKTQDDIGERNREIEEGVFQGTDDPRHPLVAPASETVPPHLNFAPLENATEELAAAPPNTAKRWSRSAQWRAQLASASLRRSKPFADRKRAAS